MATKRKIKVTDGVIAELRTHQLECEKGYPGCGRCCLAIAARDGLQCKRAMLQAQRSGATQQEAAELAVALMTEKV